MPFNTKTVMDQKQEFVLLAGQGAISFSELCRRYDISRKTGYKWLARFEGHGISGLLECSRKPHQSPLKTQSVVEQRIIELRREYPDWGSKKLHKLLERDKAEGKFDHTIPARSTINEILKRHGLINVERSLASAPWQRFEYQHPNELWQMDFKGHFKMLDSKICHPMTITDDHSRFNIALFACQNERYETVQPLLIQVFEKYGIPDTILTDNGAPWGTRGLPTEEGGRRFSTLEKWLITKRIRLIHGRPYHPQTQGKEERFHRTLNTELISKQQYQHLQHCQIAFNNWRNRYNHYRPHEAIGMDVPSQRYKPSLRAYENVTEKPQYYSTDIIRKVDEDKISFKGRKFKVGDAFAKEQVAIRPTNEDGIYEVYFYDQFIRKLSFI